MQTNKGPIRTIHIGTNQCEAKRLQKYPTQLEPGPAGMLPICEFIRASVLLCLENTTFLVVSTLSDSYTSSSTQLPEL